MSNVTLAIAGLRYKIACDSGEEAHVAMLGQLVDDRLAEMPNIAAQPETRRLLYAALLLADEVHELRRQAAGDGGDVLESLAERLERVAQDLEGAAA
jgi:cell division protein ZapA